MSSADAPGGLPEDSVLAGLHRFDWHTEESVRYEVALEMLSQLVAGCTRRIAQERAKPSPDAAVIDHCRQLQRELTDERRRLRSSDPQAVARVLAEARDRSRRILDHR
jgi:hypothetical protein